jgi:hypothetical protein
VRCGIKASVEERALCVDPAAVGEAVSEAPMWTQRQFRCRGIEEWRVGLRTTTADGAARWWR